MRNSAVVCRIASRSPCMCDPDVICGNELKTYHIQSNNRETCKLHQELHPACFMRRRNVDPVREFYNSDQGHPRDNLTPQLRLALGLRAEPLQLLEGSWPRERLQSRTGGHKESSTIPPRKLPPRLAPGQPRSCPETSRTTFVVAQVAGTTFISKMLRELPL